MKRNLQYIKNRTPEFFKSEFIKNLKGVRFSVSYAHVIDMNYLNVKHDEGYIRYTFNEKSGELTRFSGNYIREQFIRENQRVE
jgi:hypothetical protein